MDCGDHPALRVNRVADSDRSRREASKTFPSPRVHRSLGKVKWMRSLGIE